MIEWGGVHLNKPKACLEIFCSGTASGSSISIFLFFVNGQRLMVTYKILLDE